MTPLFNTFDPILKTLGIAEPSPSLRLASLFLGFQIVCIGLLVCYIVVLRWVRNYAAAVDAQRSQKCENFILEVLTSHLSNSNETILLPQLESQDRERYRRILLEQVLAITGAENTLLANLYVHLGLVQDDLLYLKSFFWWKRLAAIGALECLGRTRELSNLIPLLDDSHPLVSLSAMRVVCILSEDMNDLQNVLNRIVRFSKVRNLRHDVQVEIFIQIARKYPAMFFVYLDFARLENRTDFIEPALRACLQVRDPDSSRVIVPLLQSQNNEIVRLALEVLEQLGDPSVISNVRVVLQHSEKALRTLAARVEAKLA